MAKILYEVKRNQNSYSQAYGKWYAQIKSLETLNTRKLAQHISRQGPGPEREPGTGQDC